METKFMAQMIPTEIFYGREYDTESGAEMALFKKIKNEPNNFIKELDTFLKAMIQWQKNIKTLK